MTAPDHKAETHAASTDENPEFSAWARSLPPKHWAKHDLAAAREGWEAALASRTSPAPDNQASFQQRVAPWMQECFGPEISADRLERGDRLLEELLELLQSGDYPRGRISALTDYVYSRPVGDPHQEVGGVMVTLAAYCLAHDVDMHRAAEDELARIWTKVDKIRAKQATKPVGSALPVPVDRAPDNGGGRVDRYHFTNDAPVSVTMANGNSVQIGDGWLAITEAEYTLLHRSTFSAGVEAAALRKVAEEAYWLLAWTWQAHLFRAGLALDMSAFAPEAREMMNKAEQDLFDVLSALRRSASEAVS